MYSLRWSYRPCLSKIPAGPGAYCSLHPRAGLLALNGTLQVPNRGSACCKERAHTASVRAPSSSEAAFKLGSRLQAMHPVDPDLSHGPWTDLPACPPTCLTTMNLPGLPADPSFHHWACPARHTWVQQDWAAVGWSLPQPHVLSLSVLAPSSAESRQPSLLPSTNTPTMCLSRNLPTHWEAW